MSMCLLGVLPWMAVLLIFFAFVCLCVCGVRACVCVVRARAFVNMVTLSNPALSIVILSLH